MTKSLMGLRGKLIISFTLILIIPSTLIGIIAYTTAKDAVKFAILAGFTESVNLLDMSIDNMLQVKVHDMAIFSETISMNMYEGDSSPQLRNLFVQYKDMHPEAEITYIGTKHG